MPSVHEERRLAPDLTAPWVLPSGPSGVTIARRAARTQLSDLGVTDPRVLDTVELLVSELTSNAVKHAGGRASLKMVRKGDTIRIEVCDPNPHRVPVERGVDLDAVNGRGLLLVSSLATDWGYDRTDSEKCTWVELDLSAFESTAR